MFSMSDNLEEEKNIISESLVAASYFYVIHIYLAIHFEKAVNSRNTFCNSKF